MDQSTYKVTNYNNPSISESIGLVEAINNAQSEFEAHSLGYKLIASSYLMKQKLLPSQSEGASVVYGPLSDFNGQSFRIDLVTTLSDGREILCRFLSKGEKLADKETEFLVAFAKDEIVSTIYIVYEDRLSPQDQAFFDEIQSNNSEKVEILRIEA